MQWVRVSVGREARINPRDIVFLLEESLGLPGRVVGLIDLSIGPSFAQVPQEYLDILRGGPRELETEGGRFEVSLVPFPKRREAPFEKKRTGGKRKDDRK